MKLIFLSFKRRKVDKKENEYKIAFLSELKVQDAH